MIVADTTFLIDLLRGNPKTKKILNKKELLFTTQVNMYEVIRGLFLKDISSKKVMEISELFESIRVLGLDDASIIKSAEISARLVKKGKTISDCDCLTAGIALSHKVKKIATNNKKHFRRIKEIQLLEY